MIKDNLNDEFYSLIRFSNITKGILAVGTRVVARGAVVTIATYFAFIVYGYAYIDYKTILVFKSQYDNIAFYLLVP
jgi:hypothetical protein